MRLLLLILLVVALLPATTSIVTIADISGDGAAHAIGTGGAQWIQFIAPSGNSSVVRVGDSSITTSRGVPVAAGGGMFMPTIPPKSDSIDRSYDLSTIYYLVQSGDKLSIVYSK